MAGPSYLQLPPGELERRARHAVASLSDCRACPRNCGVDRLADRWAACKTGRYAVVSSAFPHMGEEDCLRGWRGSGTIFFAHCNLRCVFCQNFDISQGMRPGPASAGVPAEELAALMLALQARGCHNINLVTPEHVAPQVLEALALAVPAGLRLPIVYNTSAYDSLETLRRLDGVVDIYMPDFKLWSEDAARRYLRAADYPEAARAALREMHRQVGPLRTDESGLATRGVLVRHLAGWAPPMECTVYEGVRRLSGGHLMVLGDSHWRRLRYWAPRYSTPSRVPAAEIQDRCWRAISAAVRVRISDASSVGLIMSGGLDSTVVATAALEAAKEGSASLRGYSAVFPGWSEIDESDRVDALVRALRLNATQVQPRPGGLFPVLLQYMQTWAVPLTGPGLLLEYPLLHAAALDGAEVLLDGQGGDEVFGLSPYLVADRLRHGRLLSSWRLCRKLEASTGPPRLRNAWRLWRRYGIGPALPDLVYRGLRPEGPPAPAHLSKEAAALLRETADPYEWKREGEGPLWWRYKSWLLTRVREQLYLPEYLRHRASMMGVEARPPLLDLGLVQWALACRPERDFDGRYRRPTVRAALRRRVPGGVRLDGRKSNLAPFYHEGLFGRDFGAVRALLLSRRARVNEFLDPGALQALLSYTPGRQEGGWISHTTRVWNLVKVECLLRQMEDESFVREMYARTALPRPEWRIVGGARSVATAS